MKKYPRRFQLFPAANPDFLLGILQYSSLKDPASRSEIPWNRLRPILKGDSKQ